MPGELESTLDGTVAALKESLGKNLYSCCVYGSAVRGNIIEGVSDVNLLIVLNESTPAAHLRIFEVLKGRPQVDPFVLGRRGFERSLRSFASKFDSIKRNYRVIHGADPLATLQVGVELERFLCEQAVRNLRLRLVYAFVTHSRNSSYEKFLRRSVTSIFVQLAEVLRLNGTAVPNEFASRVPVFAGELAVDGKVLGELLELKSRLSRLNEKEIVSWHEQVFSLVDKVLVWIESKWQLQDPNG